MDFVNTHLTPENAEGFRVFSCFCPTTPIGVRLFQA
jgi:hypothetical protein